MVISLISATVSSDSIGNQVETLTEAEVFANEFSVSSGEYYNAALNGLRPVKMFEIYSMEYAGQDKLKHDNIPYRIIRTETKGEKTRLTCEQVAAD